MIYRTGRHNPHTLYAADNGVEPRGRGEMPIGYISDEAMCMLAAEAMTACACPACPMACVSCSRNRATCECYEHQGNVEQRCDLPGEHEPHDYDVDAPAGQWRHCDGRPVEGSTPVASPALMVRCSAINPHRYMRWTTPGQQCTREAGHAMPHTVPQQLEDGTEMVGGQWMWHDEPGPAPASEVLVHRCPPPHSSTMPCCGRTPFEVPPRDSRMTNDPALVTCNRSPAGEVSVPQAYVDLLDERAGKKHSADGQVLSTLAEILAMDRAARPATGGIITARAALAEPDPPEVIVPLADQTAPVPPSVDALLKLIDRAAQCHTCDNPSINPVDEEEIETAARALWAAGVSEGRRLEADEHVEAECRAENEVTQEIEQRERAEEVADKLTAAIGRHLGVDFGEHSNLNDPWGRAVVALAEATEERTKEQA